MYQLKQIPEDFIVKEITNIEPKSSGLFVYLKLKKEHLNTLDAIKIIAKKLRIKEKDIGFAGSKDKNALTEQIISLYYSKKEEALKIIDNNLSLEFYSYGDEPLSLGALVGNYFEITIRNLDKEKINKINHFPNYFDEQRFSGHNAEIGRFLIKKEFSKAVELIDLRNVKEYLEKKPKDYIGALKLIPLRLLRIYVNAYQSYLWNETLSQYLEKNAKKYYSLNYSLGKLTFTSNPGDFLDLKTPLIGFNGEELVTEEFKVIIDGIMNQEKLHYPDFIIKQIPELTLAGELRLAFTEIKELKIGKPEKDELNQDKKKIRLKFSLGKGSYATMAVKAMINE